MVPGWGGGENLECRIGHFGFGLQKFFSDLHEQGKIAVEEVPCIHTQLDLF